MNLCFRFCRWLEFSFQFMTFSSIHNNNIPLICWQHDEKYLPVWFRLLVSRGPTGPLADRTLTEHCASPTLLLLQRANSLLLCKRRALSLNNGACQDWIGGNRGGEVVWEQWERVLLSLRFLVVDTQQRLSSTNTRPTQLHPYLLHISDTIIKYFGVHITYVCFRFLRNQRVHVVGGSRTREVPRSSTQSNGVLTRLEHHVRSNHAETGTSAGLVIHSASATEYIIAIFFRDILAIFLENSIQK